MENAQNLKNIFLIYHPRSFHSAETVFQQIKPEMKRNVEYEIVHWLIKRNESNLAFELFESREVWEYGLLPCRFQNLK